MDFVRIAAGVKPNCPLGPRHQANTVTSFIDAEFVYGNTQSTSKRLRAFKGGLMKSTPAYRNIGKFNVSPVNERPTINPWRTIQTIALCDYI